MQTRSSPAGENQLSKTNRWEVRTGSSFLSKRESILGSFFHLVSDSTLRRSENILKIVERETGIEPATTGLGSRCSTIELLPLVCSQNNITAP